MWTTVALAVALASSLSADAGELKLTNVRTTCGVLGPPRSASSLIPGCAFALAFDIEGITIDPSGKVRYSTAIDVTNSTGKVIYKQAPRDLEAVAALGGSQIPAFVNLDIGVNQAPGDYGIKVTVTDLVTKKSQSLSRTVKVLPATFGIVRPLATTDQEGHAPATALAVGQSLWVSAGVVGFARDTASKQPHVRIDLRVLDADGKPTIDKPFSGEVSKEVATVAVSVPMQFYLLLNRAGKFTVELTATDLVANKSSKFSFPISVIAVK